jgi:hypothetical protein
MKARRGTRLYRTILRGIAGDAIGGEMVEHTFTIGKQEKYRIRIDHRATTGRTEIIVEGHSIAVVSSRGLRPLSNVIDALTISFNIGETEKHKVNIRTRGAYWNHFEAYSDSDVVYRS